MKRPHIPTDSLSVDNEPKKIKPPPIYIHPREEHKRFGKFFDWPYWKSHKLSYCTQTPTSVKVACRPLQVVLKGIGPDVRPEEIAEALKGFCAKSVHNIKNRYRQPQPLFKIELEPENKHLKK